MPEQMSHHEVRELPYGERVKRARIDAVRYAAICYLPLEARANNPNIPEETNSWFNVPQNLYAHFNHGTKNPSNCAKEMIEDKRSFYDVNPFSNAEKNAIRREAEDRASVGAAKGQVRERNYGRY